MAPDYKCMYQYVIVRKDMPKVYHIIQTAHAVQDATIAFGGPTVPQPIHLILLEVANEAQLNDAEYMLQSFGIRSKKFYEPDYDSGYTALAAELLNDSDPRRQQMKCFRMYK